MNDCEKFMKIDFNPLALKKTIDKRIQMVQTDDFSLERDKENYKIWANTDGIPYNEDIPIIETEMYFEFIKDPRVILQAILHHQCEYEMTELKEIKELK